MVPYKSDSVVLGYKIESSFDESPTQGAQTTWLAIVPSLDVDDAPDYKDYYALNSTADLFLENMGKVNVSGTIPIELQNGRPIYLAMGSESFSAGTPNTHTITGASTLPSIVLETVYDGTYDFLRYYRGLKFESLELEAVEGGEVKGSIGFKCARGQKSTNTKSTVTSVTTKPFMYHQGAVTIDSYSYDITSFKWSVNREFKIDHVIRTTDGQYSKYIIEGKRNYEITAEIIIPDVTTYNTKIYDLLYAGTPITTSISLTRTTSTDDMTLTASNCTIRSAPHNIPEVGEEIRVPITIKPRTCQWVIHDSVGSYAT